MYLSKLRTNFDEIFGGVGHGPKTSGLDFDNDLSQYPDQDPDSEIFDRFFDEIFGGVGMAQRTIN